MVFVLGISVLVLLITVIFLIIKIYNLRHTAIEIEKSFREHLQVDTNTLLDVSTRDKTMLRLVVSLNKQLKLLCKQRQRYINGDQELKEAITNISHDLRTPLTAISGYLDLLDREEKKYKHRTLCRGY